MVKLVYTHASGACGAIRESSSLSIPTIHIKAIHESFYPINLRSKFLRGESLHPHTKNIN